MADVPNIPPLSSITDPNIRAVLQALVDRDNIRNGVIGDGDKKFITVDELTKGVSGSVFSNVSGGSMSSAASKAAQSVAVAIKKISDSVMQSRAWKLLDEKIVRIETPEWFAGKFGGAIRTVENVVESQGQALAQQITTAVTNINGNIALVQNELSATSDLAGVTASATTQLQAKVGQVDVAAKESLSLATSIDGTVKATKVLSFDVNGYVAGTCFTVDQVAGKPPTSDFAVRTDRFAVGAPGASKVIPFIVDTVTGIVYMDIAMIRDLSVDTAKLKDAAIITAKIGIAQVDTLRIAGNSVTIPLFVSGSSGQQFGAGTGDTAVLAVAGYFPDTAQVALTCFVQADNPGDATNVGMRIVLDGSTTVLYQINSTQNGYVEAHTAMGSCVVGAGWHSFHLMLSNPWNNGIGWYPRNISLLVMGTVR